MNEGSPADDQPGKREAARDEDLLLRPVRALATPRVRLVLLSAAVLFLELFLIRWIPANVRYIGFFSNLLLLGCFLGMGTGILAGRNGRALPVFAPLLLAVVLLVGFAQLNVQLPSGTTEVFFGLRESKAADVNFVVLPLTVALVTLLMASLAQPLGPLLRSLPPLEAYALDLTGSLLGIAAFTALAACGTPPIAWFACLAGLLAALGLGRGVTTGSVARALLVVAAGAALVFGGGERGRKDSWSPYYRVSTYPVSLPGQPEMATAINVDGIPHQVMSPAVYTMSPDTLSPYDQVYRWFPERHFDNVLIVGAGSGSDTALALARGAKHVDSVEIDPRIAELGRELHPDHPYSDEARVSLHVTDGRHFLRSSTAKYDLVIFALPDSLTLVSSMANVRLESFLFTREAFEDVRARLAPDGLFCLYNYYRMPWLKDKIAAMLEEAFREPPLVAIAGENVLAVLVDGPGIHAAKNAPAPGRTTDAPIPATDDWPFLYLRERGVPSHYLVALGLLLVFAAALVGIALRAERGTLALASPHFFALGTAFMLLETRSLVTMSLLFGTTWLVNALTFFAILASVLLAVGVNALVRARRPGLLYAALLGMLALGWALPPESLLLEPAWLRYALASALAFAPVFLANLVFTHSFRDSRAADLAFASNLVGAAVGGAFEYAALALGYRALLVLAAGLYVAAYLLGNRWRLLGDRALAPETV